MAISPELIDTPNQMLRCPTRAGSKLVCASVTLEAKDPNEPLPEYIGKDIIDSNGNFSLKWTSQTKVEYTIIGTYAGCAGVQMVGIPVLLSGIDPNGSIFDIGKTTKIDSNGKFSIKWTPHIEGECQIIGWIEK